MILGVDWAQWAIVVPALTGAVLGIGGFWRGYQADQRSAETGERSVAREEFELALGAQRDLLAIQKVELADQRTEIAELRKQVAEVREHAQRCEADLALAHQEIAELKRTA